LNLGLRAVSFEGVVFTLFESGTFSHSVTSPDIKYYLKTTVNKQPSHTVPDINRGQIVVVSLYISEYSDATEIVLTESFRH